MQMLTETLKLLITGMDILARHSSELQPKAMELLVQLMVLCAQPGSREMHPALVPLVSQTMTLLAAGKHSPAFRTALLLLSPASRNTLQVRPVLSLARLNTGIYGQSMSFS